MTARFLVADVFDGLATLDDNSVDLVVTSPPFLALRSYLPADHPDKAKEIGSEATPAEFLDVMLRVTAELRRVLAPHGSICIELGDTYAGSGGAGGDYDENGLREGQPKFRQGTPRWDGRPEGQIRTTTSDPVSYPSRARDGWPLAKSRTLIPQLFEIALAYGINPLTGQPSPAGQWRIRNIITWARPNPPVGALGDKWRPATSDLIVACTSSKRYWDDLATRRPHLPESVDRSFGPPRIVKGKITPDHAVNGAEPKLHSSGAPLLDYWVIPPGGYTGAHYAVFPEELVVPCVKAMCPPKVCQTCGEPSRRIVKDDSAFDVQPLLAAHIKERRLAAGITSDEINGWFGFKEIAKNWERTDSHGAAIPNSEVWPILKERLGLSDEFDSVVLGERRWTESLVEYEANGQTLERDERRTDYGRGGNPEAWGDSRIKASRSLPDAWSDCGHDNWRPGLILDPFAGSGTTLAVATGHGHDAIGIDLDERNAVLARERVGPFLFEQVTV